MCRTFEFFMEVFRGVFQTFFGGLGEGVFAIRNAWFGD